MERILPKLEDHTEMGNLQLLASFALERDNMPTQFSQQSFKKLRMCAEGANEETQTKKLMSINHLLC